VPRPRVAYRAKKSELPQASAVAKPSRIPIISYEDLRFTARPSSTMTF
jgi:hypothetical protein